MCKSKLKDQWRIGNCRRRGPFQYFNRLLGDAPTERGGYSGFAIYYQYPALFRPSAIREMPCLLNQPAIQHRGATQLAGTQRLERFVSLCQRIGMSLSRNRNAWRHLQELQGIAPR